MRLDLVDPEALFDHAARLVQQLFELAQSERSHLEDQSGQKYANGISHRTEVLTGKLDYMLTL